MDKKELNYRKVAVIGCGFVGAASAFALMQSGLFSEMVLIDADQKKAEGEAMDISHGEAYARPMRIYAGNYDDITDAAIIVITAGANQKEGETRLDLVQKNVGIFKNIIPQIAQRNYQGILLIVANPVDILTYTALKLSGLPESRVIGSGTVLDTARLREILGNHLGVDSRSVHAFIIGEHGDSEIPVWSTANVAGVLRTPSSHETYCRRSEKQRLRDYLPQKSHLLRRGHGGKTHLRSHHPRRKISTARFQYDARRVRDKRYYAEYPRYRG